MGESDKTTLVNNPDTEMRMEGFKKIGDDMERVIEKDDSNSSVTTESEEAKNMQGTFRDRLCHTLNTNKFQITIMCMVILDCILIIAELLVELQVFAAHGDEGPPKVAEILHFMSIGILSLFLIEIMIKLYAFRLEFFHHKLEVFDALIVIISFSLDVAFRGGGAEVAVELLIILRLWRVGRILNGVVMSVKTQAERRLAREKASREAVEQELSKFREYCSAQEKEIEILQGLLRKHGVQFDQVERPVMGKTINVVAEVNELTDKFNLQEVDLNNSTSA